MRRLQQSPATAWSVVVHSVLLLSVVGCGKDFHEKHPTFPAWGWWDAPHPAPKDDASAPATQPADDAMADSTPVDEGPMDYEALDAYRRQRWPDVQPLQELSSMTPEKRNKTVMHVLANLEQWYRPLPVAMPDVSRKDWTSIVLWDFMPDEEFIPAAERWRGIAASAGVDYPAPPTRRGVQAVIQTIVHQPNSDASPTGQAERKDVSP
jgi:hypothetical protein